MWPPKTTEAEQKKRGTEAVSLNYNRSSRDLNEERRPNLDDHDNNEDEDNTQTTPPTPDLNDHIQKRTETKNETKNFETGNVNRSLILATHRSSAAVRMDSFTGCLSSLPCTSLIIRCIDEKSGI